VEVEMTFPVLLSLVACSLFGGEEPAPPPAPEPAPVEEPKAPEAKPGRIPGTEYPVVETTAKAGEMVLTPSREFLDKAVAEGLDQAGFIFYMAEMVEPGPVESKVKGLAGTEFSMPNSLIVPLMPGQEAAKGDVLLGHWESGSGMYRAIVVDDAVKTEPKVRYLDGTFKADDQPDQWKANRFHKLEAGTPGVTVACKKDETTVEHGTLIHAMPKQLVAVGFAGKLHVYETANCAPLAPKADVKAGQKVQVPFLGTYREATVSKVDLAVGRVFAKFEFGGAEKEEAFGLADVTAVLPAYGEGFQFGDRAQRPEGGEGREGKAKAGGGGEEGKAGKGGKAKGGKGGKAD
jgi:hypothetical protein